MGTRFQVLFHSPPGVLFTIPSRYSSAIGHQVVFRLTQWSAQIHSGFLGPGATRDTHQQAHTFRLRGYHPLRRAFQDPSTTHELSDCPTVRQNRQVGPTTPYAQRLPAVTRARFSLVRFRSPLLTEYLLLPVLRCFTSRRSLPAPMYSGTGSTTRLVLGFPIRTPSDHGSLANSPRIIAGCYVLLRLLVPRHPPCALHELHTTKILQTKEQRCSRPLYSSRTTTPGPRHHPPPPPPPRARTPVRETDGPGNQGPRPRRALPQDPTACQDPPPRPDTGPGAARETVDVPPKSRPAHRRRSRRPRRAGPPAPGPATNGRTHHGRRPELLRKEVIQPHLPVRLPCYDLVLIASPTFDRSPPHGLGHGLRVLPTFMT